MRSSALEKSFELKRLATEIARIGEVRYNPVSGETAWNEEAYHIFGVDRSEPPISGEVWLDAVHPGDKDRVRKLVIDHLKGRKGVSGETLAYRIVRPCGGVRHVRASHYFYYDDNGTLVDTLTVYLDMTEEMLLACTLESEKKNLAETLHDANELVQITIRPASEGIVRTDERGVITFCNSVASQFVGARPEALAGRVFGEVFRFLIGAREIAIGDPVAIVLSRGDPIKMNSTLKLRGDDGSLARVNLAIAPTLRANSVVGAIALIHGASEDAVLTDRLAHAALTDDLTGLGNRRAFEGWLEECERNVADGGRRDYVLCIDLDHFKIVNNVCGREAGNQLLCDVAEMFLSCVRKSDLVARIGGDEFAIIMRRASEAGAIAAANKIIGMFAEHRLSFDDETLQIGASIGLAEARPGISASELMGEANTACLMAKQTGRGRHYVFRTDDDAISDQRRHDKIRDGMESGLFRIFLQCIVSNEGNVVGYNGLLHLEDDQERFGPDAFMETARRHNLLPKLDRFTLRRALALLQNDGSRNGDASVSSISVNLSAMSIADPAFRSWMNTILDEHEDCADRLCLELVELEQMKWADVQMAFLCAVRDRGVRLYLDDFGAGYNSFDLLKKIEVDGLKLDGSVTKNIVSNPIDQALAGASLGVARNFDLDIIAEGVDDEATFEFLSSLGVKKFQGRLFHLAEDAEKLLGLEPEIEQKSA